MPKKRRTSALAPAPAPTPAPGFATLFFSDDFNGPAGAKPDSAKWEAKAFAQYGVYAGLERISLDGQGSLVIDAVWNGADWLTGWLSGRVAYVGPHRIEARAKVAVGTGAWSAPVWEWDAPYGEQGTENDVCEQLGSEPGHYYATLHSGDAEVGRMPSIPTLDWHVYGADVHVDRVEYFLDGAKVGTITKADMGGKWGFDTTRMVANISLNMLGWGGPTSDFSPRRMLVDWLRVWTP